jgi:hypothetical protein
MWSTTRFTPAVAVAARTAVRRWCSNSISPESVVEPSLVDTTTVQGGNPHVSKSYQCSAQPQPKMASTEQEETEETEGIDLVSVASVFSCMHSLPAG